LATNGEPLLLRACRGESVPTTPVWFMRQAGRSLPEYRALRAGIPMLEACQRPDLIMEITMQPVRRHGVDAAILFSDIVVPLVAAGLDITIEPGVGPVVANPIRTAADVDRIPDLDAGQLEFLATAIAELVRELGPTPLIGFAGAPFTLASYLIEGGPSKTHERTKAFLYSEPDLWDRLAGKLAAIAATFLNAQVAAGVRALQLFDSWAGALDAADYARYVQPHSAAVLRAVAHPGVPRIHFGVGTGELLALMGDAGADVVGVDWRLPLDVAAERTGGRYPLQGNLDPALLLAPWPVLSARADAVLTAGRSAPGHIFNLGHGVPAQADPGVLTRLVEHVHEASTRVPE
jgi:uroporphyrinogen decarboxylase